MIALGILGVLFAFPLKRRFINDEQHPFPEGRAAGIVMDSLHTDQGSEGLLKAALLTISAVVSALIKLGSSAIIMGRLKLGALTVPEFLDEWLYRDGWIYRFVSPRLWDTELRQLTVRPDTDLVMMAAGGLMGIRTGASLMIGAIVQGNRRVAAH